MDKVRAKFSVEKIQDGSIQMRAVHDNSTPENQRFTKATPAGTLNMSIDNKSAMDFFQQGKMYYLDFTEADQ